MVGGQGDISQDIDGGGTLRGTSRAQYTHGGGTLRGTSRARYTRGGGTNGTFFFTVWDGITCLVHLRWGDKRDIFFPVVVRTWWRDKRDIFLQLLAGAKVDSRARYIHGGGTEGTHAVGCGDKGDMFEVPIGWLQEGLWLAKVYLGPHLGGINVVLQDSLFPYGEIFPYWV
ncbi:hypothetical protein B0H16DRAFT_1467768 [Mycena metata]|uniref:Uncharacterized protein n=1 Tax=Mycena metata TaxID=1033252 RepID=A0AAD7MV77_9AGAR|nr:hypothetical protein B0H16DRAFT_1467768 [Mycena metata]